MRTPLSGVVGSVSTSHSRGGQDMVVSLYTYVSRAEAGLRERAPDALSLAVDGFNSPYRLMIFELQDSHIRRPDSPSHYPSWGLETLTTVSPAAKARYSLPLMGIGNVAGWRAATGINCSLPLMGIGNTPLQRGVTVRPSSPSHYPSWGLETRIRDPAAGRKRPARSHYPSWGLETVRMMSPSTSYGSMYSHYPSWGLETRRSSGAWSAGHRRNLITPHGDWKLYRLEANAIGWPCSLPLMGIGNRIRERGLENGLRGLITPHGDWKPCRCLPQVRA